MTTSAILITADQLGASYLGPYGNTWLETPAVNQFASTARLYEFALADSIENVSAMRAITTGRHAAWDRPSTAENLGDAIAPPRSSNGSLITALESESIRSIFIGGPSDEDELLDALPDLEACHELITISDIGESVAADLEETCCFETFAAGLAALEQHPEGGFAWLHFAGLASHWDAPIAMREFFHDEDDPPIHRELVPPSLQVDETTDPDELFRYTMSYAAQVRVFDMCLEFFLQNARHIPGWRNSLIGLSSTGGFPLGEHGVVGTTPPVAFGERLRIPLIFQEPDSREGSRRRQLVQPISIHETLRSWFGLPPGPNQRWLGGSNLTLPFSLLERSARTVAVSVDDQQSSLRTPAWFLQRQQNHCQLYVKPDDLWEINDVADRCAPIVEELSEQLDLYLSAAAGGETHDAVPGLTDVLLHGFR